MGWIAFILVCLLYGILSSNSSNRKKENELSVLDEQRKARTKRLIEQEKLINELTREVKPLVVVPSKVTPSTQLEIKKDEAPQRVPPDISIQISKVSVSPQIKSTNSTESESESESQWIRNFIQERGITYLIHFTRLENVPAILKYGLLGKTELDLFNIKSSTNDLYRYDNVSNSICCSIMFPNYLMFYKLRMENPESEWVVLRLKPEILWRKQCAFCFDNAASRHISHTPLIQRSGLQALESMFVDHAGMPSRENLGLPENYPTSPQAEILILESIEADLISDICFVSKVAMENSAKSLKLPNSYDSSINFTYNRSQYFDARFDSRHWRK